MAPVIHRGTPSFPVKGWWDHRVYPKTLRTKSKAPKGIFFHLEQQRKRSGPFNMCLTTQYSLISTPLPHPWILNSCKVRITLGYFVIKHSLMGKLNIIYNSLIFENLFCI